MDDFASDIFIYTPFANVNNEFIFQTLTVDHTKINQIYEGRYAIGFTVFYENNGALEF